MTQEELNILNVDLCARLPYGVKIKYLPDDRLDGIVLPYLHNRLTVLQKGAISYRAHIKSIRPYLRPLSSMTEEEEIYYDTIYTTLKFYEKEDWLNEHHFDYRIDPSTGKTLIESDIALEALKGMYKTE